jgi:hypothetical protein
MQEDPGTGRSFLTTIHYSSTDGLVSEPLKYQGCLICRASTSLARLQLLDWEGGESWHNGTYFSIAGSLRACSLDNTTPVNLTAYCVLLPPPLYVIFQQERSCLAFWH